MADSEHFLTGEQDDFFKNLLVNAAGEENLEALQKNLIPRSTVVPKPGFCLKTADDKGNKIFINVCNAENIPAPHDITDSELLELLEQEDPSGFRIPMSLGEAHAEIDNKGKGCTAYDVIVNPDFFLQLQKRDVLLGFFLTVVLEGLEYKYDISLSRDWKILKNRRLVGNLPEQNVRTTSKPLIMEVDPSSETTTKSSDSAAKPMVSEIIPDVSKGVEPPYTILQEPAFGMPEFLVAEIHLPKVKMANSLSLDVGEDRLLLQTRSKVYHLDIYLPFDLKQDEVGAQFNRATQILTVTMPVAS